MHWIFYVAAVVAIVATAMVITRPNAVHALLYLIVSLLAVALIFFRLGAPFIAALEVITYAGAIMVLFLFIIMLLDLRTEELRKINWVASAGGLAVALALMVQIFAVIGRFSLAKQTFPSLARSTSDDVHRIGLLLFDNYNLPFQIIGVVILVATIGAVMLSRRETR